MLRVQFLWFRVEYLRFRLLRLRCCQVVVCSLFVRLSMSLGWARPGYGVLRRRSFDTPASGNFSLPDVTVCQHARSRGRRPTCLPVCRTLQWKLLAILACL